MPRSLVRSDWSITSTLMRHSFACVCTVTEDYVTTVPDSVQNGWMEWQANIYDTSYYMCDANSTCSEVASPHTYSAQFLALA